MFPRQLHRIPPVVNVHQHLEGYHRRYVLRHVVQLLQALYHVVPANPCPALGSQEDIAYNHHHIHHLHAMAHLLPAARFVPFLRQVAHHRRSEVVQRIGEPCELHFQISLCAVRCGRFGCPRRVWGWCGMRVGHGEAVPRHSWFTICRFAARRATR